MSWVRVNDWEVGVAFAEQTVPKHPDVTDIKHKRSTNLPAYREVVMAHFRIAKVIRNRTQPPKEPRCQKRREETIRWAIRVERENRWLGECRCEQIYPIEVQGIQRHVKVSKLRYLSERSPYDALIRVSEQGVHETTLIMRAPRQAYSGLEVIMVRRAGRDNTITLQTSARHVGLYRASLEGAVFKIVTHAVVQCEVRSYLPRILNVEAIDVIRGVDLGRPDSDLELRRQARIGRGARGGLVEGDMELSEHGGIREVTDVKPGLHCMRTVGPGEVVNKLIPVLIGALRTTECS